MKTKYLVHTMQSGMVISDGQVRRNTETYMKCQEEVVLSWIESLVAGRPYVWL